MAQRIVLDEKAIREEFIRHNADVQEKSIKAAKKELQGKRNRIEELFRLMQLAYEDRLKGKMPEDICIGFIQKYSDEQKKLEAEIEELEAKLTEKILRPFATLVRPFLLRHSSRCGIGRRQRRSAFRG